jgi:hypothetical protein
MRTDDEAATILLPLRPDGRREELTTASHAGPPRGQLASSEQDSFQTATKVKISCLVRAESPRSGGEDADHIQRLLEAESWPPIIVHQPTMRIIDGFHRVSAATRKGLDEIDAVLIDESWELAFLVAVRANVTHGLPLSLADRRAAARKIVRTHSELSDRAIGTTAGLSPGTVRAIRASIVEAPQGNKRLGKDGRVRPLNAAAGRKLAADYLESHPDASLREIATAVGISPGTVRDVRARLSRGEDPVPTPSGDNRVTSQGRDFMPPPLTADDAGQPADVNPVLATLSKDPSLRMSDAGRELLRWLRLHAVNSVDSAKMVDTVPDHCIDHLVVLASRCSANWARIAHDLSQRSQQRQDQYDQYVDISPRLSDPAQKCG